MIEGFRSVAYRIKFLAPLFILGSLAAAGILGVVAYRNWDEGLYPGLLLLMWSLLGLCFVWWFQPPAPNTVLLTTAWGRFKAKIGRFFSALKCFIFVVLFLGVLSLTIRFLLLWQGM